MRFRYWRGGSHEIAHVYAIVLAILLSLAVFLPAPGRAADVPADRLLIGALPPPFVTLLTAERQLLCRKDATPATQYDIRLQEDPAEDDSEPAIVLNPDEYRRLKQGVAGLSPEEYKLFKQMINNQRATALQVAAVNLAMKGTGLLIVGLAWIGLLWILRRTFDRWFDANVYDDTWASTVVIAVLLIVTGWIIVSVVN